MPDYIITTPLMSMSNQITVEEFRSNYDHYLKRMEAGETFSIIDIDENKQNLYLTPDDKGIAIDMAEIKF